MADALVTLARQDLYELVWSKPMTKVASDLGIAYREFRQACKRLAVPCPSSGYWEKVRAGKQMSRPGLPEFIGPQSIQVPKATNSPSPAPLQVVVIQATRLERLHPLVALTKRLLDPASRNSSHFLNRGRLRLYRSSNALNCTVSPEQKDRALLIWESIIRSGEVSGLEFNVSHERSYVSGWGIQMWARLFESVRSEPDPPSRWPKDVLTGNLRFLCSGPYSANCRFSDAPDSPLENQIEQIIGRIVKTLKGATAQKEKLDLKLAEYKKQEITRLEALAEQEEKRKQRIEAEKQEAARREELQEEASRWMQTRQIRDYVSAVVVAGSADGDVHADSLIRWAEWGNRVAAEIDPIPRRMKVLSEAPRGDSHSSTDSATL